MRLRKMNPLTYANAILTIIAGLLAFIAYHLHTHRPFTQAEYHALAKAKNIEALKARIGMAPYFNIWESENAIEVKGDVDVHGEVTVNGEIDVGSVSGTVDVRIER